MTRPVKITTNLEYKASQKSQFFWPTPYLSLSFMIKQFIVHDTIFAFIFLQ